MAYVPIIQYTNYDTLLNTLTPTTTTGKTYSDSITASYNTTVTDLATLNTLSAGVANPLLGGVG